MTDQPKKRFAPRECDSTGCNHVHEPEDYGPRYCHQCLREESAPLLAEIDRLRPLAVACQQLATVEPSLRRALEDARADLSRAHDALDRRDSEIDRLRAELERERDWRVRTERDYITRGDELTQLRADLAAANKRWAEEHDDFERAWNRAKKAESDLAAAKAEIHRLREINMGRTFHCAQCAEYAAQIARGSDEIETLRMQLVGCGTAAFQNTEASKAERIDQRNPYWSVAYSAVCAAVDREIALRAERDAATTRANVAEKWIRSVATLERNDTWSAYDEGSGLLDCLIREARTLATLTPKQGDKDQ